MSDLVLETHLYSSPPTGSPPPWSRSFHLRLAATATKADLLTLVRDSVTRLGRTDPVVDAQVTLYWTRNGHAVFLPGNPSINTINTTGTVALPIYQPAQVLSVNTPAVIQQQQQQMTTSPGWPLALTYANGVNYLHSYGPSPTVMTSSATVAAAQQTVVVGGGTQLGFVNVGVPTVSVAQGGRRPIVSEVVREARLDGIAEGVLAGMLEWAVGPTGLKLIVAVDVDGRDVVPAVVSLPEPAETAEPAPAS